MFWGILINIKCILKRVKSAKMLLTVLPVRPLKLLLHIHNDFCAFPIVRMLSPMELNISLWRPLGNEHLWPLRTRQSVEGERYFWGKSELG